MSAMARCISLSLLLIASGCKQDASAPAALSAMKPEELSAHLKLTGLAEDGPSRWALFVLAVPGQPTEHLKLKEGQRLGGLEVLAIDPSGRSVDVRLQGQNLTLSLAADGLKPEDGYAWLQRLTPDEHARNYNSPARRQLVDDHAKAQEERQREELAREIEEREKLLQEAPGEQPEGN